MDNYIILDIENPNSRANSICSISIIVVKNNQVADTLYTLVNPEDRFDPRNIELTGINASAVLNKPTLKNLWPDIETLLTNNIIIGHGITYDLSVISKSLIRYDIEAPTFQYIDTLSLARKYINIDSHQLSALSDYLDYKYNAHNALEDTRATLNLFNYLKQHFDLDKSLYGEYKYLYKTTDKLNDKLSSNINELHGIIKGINYDGVINTKEVETLKKWVNDNLIYRQYTIFNKIIDTLNRILEDNIVDEYERIELLNLVSSIHSSKIYNETTLNLQILNGIINGISCDNNIVVEEVEGLKKWLEINSYLSGVYPYDKILSITKEVLKDGILTYEEKNELNEVFQELLNPLSHDSSQISLNNKTFCLTGEFKNGSKSDISNKIKKLGGIEKSGVSSKVDYLFVGELGSDAWKFGKIGGKIAKAQELQEKGSSIKIINEDDLMNIVQ